LPEESRQPSLSRSPRKKRQRHPTVDVWNHRQTALKHYGVLDNVEDVYLDDFIADVKQNYDRLRAEKSQ
jgi:hypothetical protein